MNNLDLNRVPSFLIKRVSQELIRQAEVRLRPLGIGMASMPVLGALQRGEARTQAELARLLRSSSRRWPRPWFVWSGIN